jgi:hypothetical protein
MSSKLALAASGLVIAIASAAIGVAVSFTQLVQPLQKGQSEFTEAYLVSQATALQALRAGDTQPALRYLERVSTVSLVQLGAARDQGARVPAKPGAAKAVAYLCEHPPAINAPPIEGKLTQAEACYLLRKP